MSFNNPVISGFYPDPSVCKAGGDYYLVTSSFEYFPGVPLFHSRDLFNWRQIGHCLMRQSQLDLSGAKCSQGIWAPTIRFHNGTFYLITTNVGGCGSFYVTSQDPEKGWSDPVFIEKGGFDPSLFFDDDGRVYYTRTDTEQILQAEIDIATGRLLGSLRGIAKGLNSPDVEGPHMYKINGAYYLLCAEGGTRRGHCATIRRGSSPWGPFEPCPASPILTHRQYTHESIRDTGHAELVKGADDRWWIFFLGTRHNRYDSFTILGRETFMAPVEWDSDGWPVVNERQPIQESCAEKMENAGEFDDFDEDHLRLCWNMIRNPAARNYTLAGRPGYLRLIGVKASLGSKESPTFLGRRQQHFNCSVSAKIEFDSCRVNEEAGIAVYMNDSHHYAIAIEGGEAERKVIVRKKTGDIELIAASAALGAGPAILNIVSANGIYTLSCTQENSTVLLATAEAKYICSEIAEGWTGMYLGIYATGHGKSCETPADVDWFNYIPGTK